MIPNPHFPGAPVRMADSRLFTNYQANCRTVAPASPAGTWGVEVERKRVMMDASRMASDRAFQVLKAGSRGCVDTMVPEAAKRVCAWNGCATLPAQASVGIGTGRLYLPGRADLAAGDPDVLAATTVAGMDGTFSANPEDYFAAPVVARPPTEAAAQPTVQTRNRYSAPYA